MLVAAVVVWTAVAAAAGMTRLGRLGSLASCELSVSPLFTHSSQTSCGPESSGSELAPATPAPRLLQGLLGSDDEEQEDPKDYCKGKAWPWLHVASQIATSGLRTAGEEEGA